MAKLTLESLLGRGYFPKELPPSFSTKDFAKVCVLRGSSFEGAAKQTKNARLCRYNLSRPGSLDRRLAIPHPSVQYEFARDVVKNWADLRKLFKRSKISQTSPIAAAESSRRSIEPRLPQPQILDLRTAFRSTSPFVLRADISQFYPSIYTHSVPWVLHGKNASKTILKNDKTVIGNVIDQHLMNAQDRQTRGIPIGPDTSFIIAELILCECDVQLQKRISKLQGFRYFDDYELYFSSRSSAEKGLAHLQEILAEFELSLNPDKTDIGTVARSIDQPWSHIRRIEVRDTDARKQRNDLVYLFEEAIAIAQQRPKDHVLKYTIGRAENCKILEENWALYQGLLCQAAMIEPGVLPLVLREWLKYESEGDLDVDKSLAAKVLNLKIISNAPLRNSNEVAWAIWGAIALKIKIGSKATAAATGMPDSVVALVALNARKHGLLHEPSVDEDWWKAQCNAGGLKSEHWLLAYEADVQSWLPAGVAKGYVQSEPAFKYLADRNVRFYEPQFEHKRIVTHPEISSDATADRAEDDDDDF